MVRPLRAGASRAAPSLSMTRRCHPFPFFLREFAAHTPPDHGLVLRVMQKNPRPLRLHTFGCQRWATLSAHPAHSPHSTCLQLASRPASGHLFRSVVVLLRRAVHVGMWVPRMTSTKTACDCGTHFPTGHTRRGAQGELIDGGQNLAQSGMMSYTHDVLYISLFLQVATTLLSDWFFIVLLLVCVTSPRPHPSSAPQY
jgi:hypothetical protein